jgi:hypothetical protein
LCQAGLLAGLTISPSAAISAEPTVVHLTQVNCQFIESENNLDHRFTAKAQVDCEAINAKTGQARMDKALPLELKAGPTVFRVTNRNVAYALGFFLRGDGPTFFKTLPRVSGGGLSLGKTRDFVIDLLPGKYVYSCPLNPTLEYKLIVRA